MKRLVNSPLKILGFLTIIFGVLGVSTFSYFFFIGFYLVGVGLFIYLIDFFILKLKKDKRGYWIIQFALTVIYVIIVFVGYMKWQEHNYIVFPKNFRGQAGIIFGVEGYPELPKTRFWKKTINIPKIGVIITSTKEEDVPNKVQFGYMHNQKVDYLSINWDPNFEIDCIASNSKVKSWLFQIGKESSKVKNIMTLLCDEINSQQKNSLYKDENSVIWSDNKGKYLWLQDRGLVSLPSGLGKLEIYKAVLSGNNFNEVPKQIFEIASLEELILAVNPITEFPCNLSQIKRLKSISFAETKIRQINCNLSALDSLEHIDLSRNELEKFPEKIKTIPNLTWLSLNDNRLTNFSFIDNSLRNLQTFYLYSNRVRTISAETKYLVNLKELLIFDNDIDSIPDNISDLRNLEKLEIWDNPIKHVSPKIAQLKKLRSLQIDDDNLSQVDKSNLKKWLPNCKISYQTRSKK